MKKFISMLLVLALLVCSVSTFVGCKDLGFKEVAYVTYTVDGKTKTQSSTAYMSLGGIEYISEEEYESSDFKYRFNAIGYIRVPLSSSSKTPSSIAGFSNSDKGKYIYYTTRQMLTTHYLKSQILSEIQYDYIKVKVVDDDTIIIKDSRGETTYNVSSYNVVYFKK